jgi:hypothetical protein
MRAFSEALISISEGPGSNQWSCNRIQMFVPEVDSSRVGCTYWTGHKMSPRSRIRITERTRVVIEYNL